MSGERCECCGGDGILNRELPPEKQEPVWTLVRFEGAGTAHTEPLTYFLKRVCSDCNNRWQRMLHGDIAQNGRARAVVDAAKAMFTNVTETEVLDHERPLWNALASLPESMTERAADAIAGFVQADAELRGDES